MILYLLQVYINFKFSYKNNMISLNVVNVFIDDEYLKKKKLIFYEYIFFKCVK